VIRKPRWIPKASPTLVWRIRARRWRAGWRQSERVRIELRGRCEAQPSFVRDLPSPASVGEELFNDARTAPRRSTSTPDPRNEVNHALQSGVGHHQILPEFQAAPQPASRVGQLSRLWPVRTLLP